MKETKNKEEAEAQLWHAGTSSAFGYGPSGDYGIKYDSTFSEGASGSWSCSACPLFTSSCHLFFFFLFSAFCKQGIALRALNTGARGTFATPK